MELRRVTFSSRFVGLFRRGLAARAASFFNRKFSNRTCRRPVIISDRFLRPFRFGRLIARTRTPAAFDGRGLLLPGRSKRFTSV